MSITSCDYCNKDHANLKCSQCKCVYYCSQACQKKDWREHKKRCEVSAMESARFEVKASEMLRYLDVLARAIKKECAVCLQKNYLKPLALPCEQKCIGCQSLYCPLCENEYSEGFYGYIYGNAAFFILMADRNPDHSAHFLAQARRELNILNRNKIDTYESRTMNAELLCLEGKYQKAISASLEIIEQEQNPTDTVQLRNIITACMGLQKYREAMQYIQQMRRNMKVLVVRGEDVTRDVYFVSYKTSECMYHLGAYRLSIQTGLEALYLNRHRENVHKWIALSQKALGQWDEAVLTMRRAVRYEAPWDAQHTQHCQALLDQLVAEQQKYQHQQQQKKLQK